MELNDYERLQGLIGKIEAILEQFKALRQETVSFPLMRVSDAEFLVRVLKEVDYD